MTNREKYIDNASNEELARFIANERCEEFYKCDKQCVPSKEDNIKGIANWLSQETEEDKREEEIISRHVEEQSECEDVAQELEKETNEYKFKEILDRIKILEYKQKTTNREISNIYKAIEKVKTAYKKEYKDSVDTYDIQQSGYGYGSVPVEKSADEMFKELGYTRVEDDFSCWEEYVKRSENADYSYEIIKIKKEGCHYYKVRTYKKGREFSRISEDERKAIRKKIEEMQKGEQDEQKRN